MNAWSSTTIAERTGCHRIRFSDTERGRLLGKNPMNQPCQIRSAGSLASITAAVCQFVRFSARGYAGIFVSGQENFSCSGDRRVATVFTRCRIAVKVDRWVLPVSYRFSLIFAFCLFCPMPIQIRCSGCARTINAPDHAAGKRVKCPACSAVLTVPAATAAAAPATAGKPAPTRSPPAGRAAAPLSLPRAVSPLGPPRVLAVWPQQRSRR